MEKTNNNATTITPTHQTLRSQIQYLLNQRNTLASFLQTYKDATLKIKGNIPVATELYNELHGIEQMNQELITQFREYPSYSDNMLAPLFHLHSNRDALFQIPTAQVDAIYHKLIELQKEDDIIQKANATLCKQLKEEKLEKQKLVNEIADLKKQVNYLHTRANDLVETVTHLQSMMNETNDKLLTYHGELFTFSEEQTKLMKQVSQMTGTSLDHPPPVVAPADSLEGIRTEVLHLKNAWADKEMLINEFLLNAPPPRKRYQTRRAVAEECKGNNTVV